MESRLDAIMKQSNYMIICVVVLPSSCSPGKLLYRFYDNIGFSHDFDGWENLPKVYRDWLLDRNTSDYTAFRPVAVVFRNIPGFE